MYVIRYILHFFQKLNIDCVFFQKLNAHCVFFYKLNAYCVFYAAVMHCCHGPHLSVTRSMCARAHSDGNHGSPCRWAHDHHCTCTPTALPSPRTPDDTVVAVRVAGCSSPRSLFSVMCAGGDHVPEHMLSRVRWSRAFILKIYIYLYKN
jgi:hypothetical protein